MVYEPYEPLSTFMYLYDHVRVENKLETNLFYQSEQKDNIFELQKKIKTIKTNLQNCE